MHATEAPLAEAIARPSGDPKAITSPETVANIDIVAFTREKVAPMVRGLFPACEQAAVLNLLERSVILLTPATIDAQLQNTPWLATAWHLANLHPAGLGADLLAEDAPGLLGLSEKTTCYLSAASFDAPGRFEDVFCARGGAHLPQLQARDVRLHLRGLQPTTCARRRPEGEAAAARGTRAGSNAAR